METRNQRGHGRLAAEVTPLRPMTPRPVLAPKSRPLSAIFIGSAGSTPPTLPDLPEPPLSPSTSPIASGLPSPPATNSTGSGSVGEGSINAGSLRHRTPTTRSDMSGGGGGDRSYTYKKKRGSSLDDEDEPDDNENDEDHTARLSDDRRRSFPKGASDNQTALLRVKNLTQRNRMVLDKLSSISRASPVPSNLSRSPMSPPTAGSSSSSATSSSRMSNVQPRPPSASNGSSNGRRRDTQLSGSETERESLHPSQQSESSDGRSVTPPPSAFPEIRAPASVRQRRISAPASPSKVRTTRERERAPSPGPSRTRKRVSTTFSVDEGYSQYRSDDEDVTAAALAAVASSRRSPNNGSAKKGRQPLPREFRERKISDEKPLIEPATPHRHATRSELGRASPSPRKNRVVASDPPASPRRLGQPRYSTVRELTRKHQTRWMSEDLSSPSMETQDDSYDAVNGGMGRRQGHRTGSSEGVLGAAGGRSLIGEGLRAAGLTKRRDEDVFTSAHGDIQEIPPRRTRSTGNSSIIAGGQGNGSPEQNRENRISWTDEGLGPPRDPKTPLNRFLDRRPQSGMAARPGTSMAALHHDGHDNAPPRTAPPALRSYKSTYTLSNRVVDDLQDQASHERAVSSPYSNYRPSTAQGGGRDNNAEHRRLMFESLSMFESHLSRLPPMGQTTTSTIPEVFQSAQHLVHALDKLNTMLKDGTNRALESQIDAELSDYKDGVDLVELWREVGSEHRENMRVSDEVVRNMTGFLLGVGKILRDASSFGGSQHLRTMSLDEDVVRRATPEVPISGSGGRDSDGRRSRETRRSWEPGKETSRLLTRLSSLERNGTTRSRPGSAMNLMRGSATSSSEGRSSSDAANDGTPATLRQSAPITTNTSAARRLYAPRDRGEVAAPMVTSFSSEDLLGDYEPSPTPVSRQAHVSLPDRRLPPLAVAPTLSTVPSESLLRRSNTSSTEKTNRRKISTSSIVTVRAEQSTFVPVIKPSNPTTAVTTHTVSASPDTDRTPFPLQRTDSGSSARTNGVTFSRPATTSVSYTLTGLQQQHERGARSRTISNASSIADDQTTVLAPPAPLSLSTSGSESERETRWKTLSSRPRASLDSNRSGESPIDAPDRSLATVSYSAARKERRRTITEIFQR